MSFLAEMSKRTEELISKEMDTESWRKVSVTLLAEFPALEAYIGQVIWKVNRKYSTNRVLTEGERRAIAHYMCDSRF